MTTAAASMPMSIAALGRARLLAQSELASLGQDVAAWYATLCPPHDLSSSSYAPIVAQFLGDALEWSAESARLCEREAALKLETRELQQRAHDLSSSLTRLRATLLCSNRSLAVDEAAATKTFEETARRANLALRQKSTWRSELVCTNLVLVPLLRAVQSQLGSIVVEGIADEVCVKELVRESQAGFQQLEAREMALEAKRTNALADHARHQAVVATLEQELARVQSSIQQVSIDSDTLDCDNSAVDEETIKALQECERVKQQIATVQQQRRQSSTNAAIEMELAQLDDLKNARARIVSRFTGRPKQQAQMQQLDRLLFSETENYLDQPSGPSHSHPTSRYGTGSSVTSGNAGKGRRSSDSRGGRRGKSNKINDTEDSDEEQPRGRSRHTHVLARSQQVYEPTGSTSMMFMSDAPIPSSERKTGMTRTSFAPSR